MSTPTDPSSGTLTTRFMYRAWYGTPEWPLWAERNGNRWRVYNQDQSLRGDFDAIEYCEPIRGEPWFARWAGDSFAIENGAHGDPKTVSSFGFLDWNGNKWAVSWNARENKFNLNPST